MFVGTEVRCKVVEHQILPKKKGDPAAKRKARVAIIPNDAVGWIHESELGPLQTFDEVSEN
jgi:hypothetical protein